MHLTVVKADVVCLVEDGKSTFGRCINCGRCYCQVADGIPPYLTTIPPLVITSN